MGGGGGRVISFLSSLKITGFILYIIHMDEWYSIHMDFVRRRRQA